MAEAFEGLPVLAEAGVVDAGVNLMMHDATVRYSPDAISPERLVAAIQTGRLSDPIADVVADDLGFQVENLVVHRQRRRAGGDAFGELGGGHLNGSVVRTFSCSFRMPCISISGFGGQPVG